MKEEKRINDIVNLLNKTKQELYPDLAAERENYDRGVRAVRKAEVQVISFSVCIAKTLQKCKKWMLTQLQLLFIAQPDACVKIRGTEAGLLHVQHNSIAGVPWQS